VTSASAGAVVDDAGVIVRAHERAERLRRIELLIAGIAVLNAVVTTGHGETRASVVTWLVAAWLVVGLAWRWPWMRARRVARFIRPRARPAAWPSTASYGCRPWP
jgi:hypothetical protein